MMATFAVDASNNCQQQLTHQNVREMKQNKNKFLSF